MKWDPNGLPSLLSRVPEKHAAMLITTKAITQEINYLERGMDVLTIASGM